MSEPFDGKPLEWSDRNWSKGPMSFRGVPLQLVDDAVEFTAVVRFPTVGPQTFTLLVDGKDVGVFKAEYIGTQPEADEGGKPVLGADGQPAVNAEYRLTKVEQA